MIIALKRLRDSMQRSHDAMVEYVAGNSANNIEDYRFAAGQIASYAEVLNAIDDCMTEAQIDDEGDD